MTILHKYTRFSHSRVKYSRILGDVLFVQTCRQV